MNRTGTQRAEQATPKGLLHLTRAIGLKRSLRHLFDSSRWMKEKRITSARHMLSDQSEVNTIC